MRPGGRRADLCGGSRAAGRWPGGGAGLDRGETRRGGSMGRTPLPCREQSRHPRKARVAETGLAAAAGNGAPQPPLRTAARRASRASRSQAASPQGPGRDGGLPITTQLPHARPASRGAADHCRAPAAAAEIHCERSARDGAPPFFRHIARLSMATEDCAVPAIQDRTLPGRTSERHRRFGRSGTHGVGLRRT